MTLIVLVAVLILETFASHLAGLRNHHRIVQYADSWQAIFDSSKQLNPWLVSFLVLLPPVLIASVLLQSQPGVFGFLFQLAVAVAIVFWSLGPKTLADFYRQQLGTEGEQGVPTNDEERALAQGLINYAHQGFLAVLIWLVLLGPVAALIYRVVHHLAECERTTPEDSSNPVWQTLFHIVDWIPTRLSALLFMLTGNFATGFSAFKQEALSTDANNAQLLTDTALKSMTFEAEDVHSSLSEARHSCERCLILLTVLIALMSFFQLT